MFCPSLHQGNEKVIPIFTHQYEMTIVESSCFDSLETSFRVSGDVFFVSMICTYASQVHRACLSPSKLAICNKLGCKLCIG